MDVIGPQDTVYYSYSVNFYDESEAAEGEGGKSIIDNRHLNWESKDQVGVFVRRSGSSISCDNKPGDVYTDVVPRKFSFTTSAELNVNDDLYAYSPYKSSNSDPAGISFTLPAQQRQVTTFTDATFSSTYFNASDMPMVAIPSKVTESSSSGVKVDKSPKFCNIASLICFRVYSSNSAYAGQLDYSTGVYNYVNRITFQSSTNGICGTGTLDITTLTEESGDAAFCLSGASGNTVSVDVALPVPSTKDEAQEVYMAVLPGTWGGTLTIETVVGNFTCTLSARDFGRSKIRTLNCDIGNATNWTPSLVTLDGKDVPAEDAFPALRSLLTGPGVINDVGAYIRATGFQSPYLDYNNKEFFFCVVCGEAGNPNMEQNLQYGNTVDGLSVYNTCVSQSGDRPNAFHIYTWENDRTNYFQSSDGKYGFRVKFSDPSLNVFQRRDKIFIWLDGVKLIREDNPVRYTLVIDENVRITKFDTWSESTFNTSSYYYTNPLTLSSLGDNSEAIYTNVKIQDLEFQIKRGCYANVREYDALTNPINKGLVEYTTIGKGFKNCPGKDGAANLLYDGTGKGIYMLMNMNCDWRWNSSTKRRKQVPQGKGTIAGILVHAGESYTVSEGSVTDRGMERWGGNIGRYSIRPLKEEDIQFTGASEWKDWVEWTANLNTDGVGSYCWNSNTTPGGYTVATTARNRLNATENTGMINNTDSKAQLYSETDADTPEQYAVFSGASYRAFDVSDYYASTHPERFVEHHFGMSFTSISFREYITSFYQWSGSTCTGYKGIVAEFSTSGKNATQWAIGFSIAGGTQDKSSNANVLWSKVFFPVNWKVQWATSNDGSTWTAWSDAGVANIATGSNSLKLRSIPFAIRNEKASVTFNVEEENVSTNSDWGFGLVPYRFTLPEDIQDKYRVKVRIVPTDCLMAHWNSGPTQWFRGQEYANSQVTSSTSGNTAIVLEDIKIQYK